jgi:hypothetical protein
MQTDFAVVLFPHFWAEVGSDERLLVAGVSGLSRFALAQLAF